MLRSFFIALTLTVFTTPLITAQAQIDRFFMVSPGIYRGSQPQSSEDYDFLQANGIKSILNLRTSSKTINQEKQIAIERRLGFESTPMSAVFYPSNKTIQKAFNFLTSQSNQPVFVHCRLGKDRTGLIIGLYRMHFESWSPRDAYSEMKTFGYNPFYLGLTMYFWNHTDRLYLMPTLMLDSVTFDE
ncbi:MAG: dual specificity protein phosphatase family protein [Bdellovibrionota bacterium]